MKRLVQPLVICAASALLAWLAGFDFNERGFDVALWSGVTGLLAGLAYFVPIP